MEFFATVPPTSLIIVVSSLSEASSGHCCWWPDECLVLSNSWLISWFSVATTVLLTHAVCCVVSLFLWELVALRWTRREKQQQPQQHNRVSAPPAVASNRNTLGEIKKSCWRNDPTNNMSQTNAPSISQWPRTQHTSNCWHPCWPCRTLWSTWDEFNSVCGFTGWVSSLTLCSVAVFLSEFDFALRDHLGCGYTCTVCENELCAWWLTYARQCRMLQRAVVLFFPDELLKSLSCWPFAGRRGETANYLLLTDSCPLVCVLGCV